MTETVIESFRTSIGGFNKGDVTNYISKTATEFDKKLKEKEAENCELQQKTELLERRISELENNSGDHQQETAILQQNNDMLRQKNTMLQQENKNLKAQIAVLQEQLTSGRQETKAAAEAAASTAADTTAAANTSASADKAAAAPATESLSVAEEQTITELELAAYRRAEAVERIAVERAKRINGEMETLFQMAAEEYDRSDEKTASVIDALTAQLTEIQEIRSQLEQSRNTVQQQFGTVCGREFFAMTGEDS